MKKEKTTAAELVLRNLGLPSTKTSAPELVAIAEHIVSKLGDTEKAIVWFKKRNPMLGASPAKMARLGRIPQIAEYLQLG